MNKNVAIICKHFYLNNIINGFKTHVGITVVNDQPVIVINDNIHNFINDIGIKVDSKVSLLPHMFSSPKFHKPSLKFRYVISCFNCSIKPLAVKVSLTLKAIYMQK